MLKGKITLSTLLLVSLALPAVSVIPSLQQLDPRLTEYVWFDNDIAVWIWNKDQPHQAVSTVPYMLSSALEPLLDNPRSGNNNNNRKKVPKPRIRL